MQAKIVSRGSVKVCVYMCVHRCERERESCGAGEEDEDEREKQRR